MTPRPRERLDQERAEPLSRARAHLRSIGMEDRLLVFDDRSTKTARLAAEAVGCELGQIVKSLVFAGETGEPVLAMVAGDRRGDNEAIARAAGAGSVSFANAEEVSAATGYAIGGVCPFDLPAGLMVLLDESLRRHATVYTAAGTPNSMVSLSPDELHEVTHGRWAAVSGG